jgi:hypothetical protein
MALCGLNAYYIYFFVMTSEFEIFANKSESLCLVWSWVSPAVALVIIVLSLCEARCACVGLQYNHGS